MVDCNGPMLFVCLNDSLCMNNAIYTIFMAAGPSFKPYSVEISSAMPVDPAVLQMLETLSHERACVSCYQIYFRKYLSKKDRKKLLMISKDCQCDWISIQSEMKAEAEKKLEASTLLPAFGGA